jgi:hypothetical protein
MQTKAMDLIDVFEIPSNLVLHNPNQVDVSSTSPEPFMFPCMRNPLVRHGKFLRKR